MPNPIKVDVPKNTWTLVAQNVRNGLITVKKWQPDRYYQTYRVNGASAPTGDNDESTSTITHGPEIPISSVEQIDVYFYCMDLDGELVVSL